MQAARNVTRIFGVGCVGLTLLACGTDRRGFDQPPPGGGSAGSGLAGGSAGTAGGTGTDDGAADGSSGGSADDGTTGGAAEPPVITDPTGRQWFDADLADDFAGAQALCDDATVGGFDDWRLPPIQSHFGVVVDCDIQSAGSCLLEDPGCLEELCGDPTSACPTCPSQPGDCFFDADVWQTDCATHRVYWSRSVCTDCGAGVYWAYDFGAAAPLPLVASTLGSIRCVR